jgi:protein-S-isoprenylcysteine O-methyltransferase Ste14
MRIFAWIEILALWIIWWSAYLFRAPKVQKRESITVFGPTSLGLLLETAGIFVVWFAQAPGAPRTGLLSLAAALVFGVVADVLMWTAVAHLGRQFRIYAGLYHDHQLVRTGPYAVVRHPIYASLLAVTVSTGLLLTRWEWLVAGVVLFVAGTEIRVHTEEKLLASRFGAEFTEYKSKVPAYVPFVR